MYFSSIAFCIFPETAFTSINISAFATQPWDINNNTKLYIVSVLCVSIAHRTGCHISYYIIVSTKTHVILFWLLLSVFAYCFSLLCHPLYILLVLCHFFLCFFFFCSCHICNPLLPIHFCVFYSSIFVGWMAVGNVWSKEYDKYFA